MGYDYTGYGASSGEPTMGKTFAGKAPGSVWLSSVHFLVYRGCECNLRISLLLLEVQNNCRTRHSQTDLQREVAGAQ
eukprot:403291-Pelagomonas_calceolata.AAC.5